jgi:ATP-grasp domain, R2K clade family 3
MTHTATVVVDTRIARGVPLPASTPSWAVLPWEPSQRWTDDADALERGCPPGPLLLHTTVPIARGILHQPARWPRLAGAVSLPNGLLECHQQNGRLGVLALNRTALYAPLGQLDALDEALEKAVGPDRFLRPNSPYKPFAGRPVPAGDWALELATIRAIDRPGEDTLCMVAPLQRIEQPEWRFWCVDGEPATWAPYAFEAGPWPGLEPARDLIHAAQQGAERLLEGDGLLVVDVCRDADGAPRVVEANGFSTSGFYPGMDLVALWEKARTVWM